MVNVITKEYRIRDNYRMISAVGEQQKIKLWDYAIDDEGTHWLWPAEHPEPGAMVHCGDTVRVGKRSEGYGGRVMEFPTKDGVVKIQGPWHSNTEALFQRTGVDLRDKHHTWGLVALDRDYESNDPVFKDVLYLDPDAGVVGKFDRITELAQQFADQLGRPVYYFARSSGGSSHGPVLPGGWDAKKKELFYMGKLEYDNTLHGN